jgi:Na+-driven multidrug efflux pump
MFSSRPALAALGLGNPTTVFFVFAMFVGMGGHTALPSLFSRREKHA